MKIVVLVKLVPDLVEELTIATDGVSLDTAWMRMIINEFDDHAVEQAIVLKEKFSGSVTVIAPEYDGVDEVLFTAIAKGADQAIKMVGDISNTNNHALARGITGCIKGLNPDLVLTGVQANNDADGSIGPLLAGRLEMPFIGYVSGVNQIGNDLIVKKEYPGGVIAEVSVKTPVVLGIQAAEQPPRYVAVSKVRQIMKTASIESQQLSDLDSKGALQISRMYQSEALSHADMISGDPQQVADRLIAVFKTIGVL